MSRLNHTFDLFACLSAKEWKEMIIYFYNLSGYKSRANLSFVLPRINSSCAWSVLFWNENKIIFHSYSTNDWKYGKTDKFHLQIIQKRNKIPFCMLSVWILKIHNGIHSTWASFVQFIKSGYHILTAFHLEFKFNLTWMSCELLHKACQVKFTSFIIHIVKN